jgi:hypothetical protein
VGLFKEDCSVHLSANFRALYRWFPRLVMFSVCLDDTPEESVRGPSASGLSATLLPFMFLLTSVLFDSDLSSINLP